MSRRLFDIIKDDTLVDNQSYSADNVILSNSRELLRKLEGSRYNAQNNEQKIWNFITAISRDLSAERLTQSLVFLDKDYYEFNQDSFFINVMGRDAGNFTLNTGNLVGVVSRDGYTLKISSRFGNEFLKYIISDADGFLEINDFPATNEKDSYPWLLAYLWNIKLKRAYRLGIPKVYSSKSDRISTVRGSIDPLDYFKNNLSGKYLCSFREHDYASTAISLFLMAYDTVKHHSFCKQTRYIYNAFMMANQGKKSTRKEILATPHFNNPYYSDYNTLIDLSKRIISQKSLDFGSSNTSNAYLFDISMLFEYFIRKLLIRSSINVRSKFESLRKIQTCNLGKYERKLEPDLIIEGENGVYIFDVKYKHFDEKYGVNREDLFQLHTYIGQWSNTETVCGGGFIFPITEKKWKKLNLENTQGVISNKIQQQGKEIDFYVIFLPIPKENFYNTMKENCERLCKVMKTFVMREYAN
ncbi:restriction endonuclease [Pasteurella multocida]